MNALIQEWIEKAESDFATATRERRVRKSPNFDAVCFHAQQCIEKYLKAILVTHQKPFQKTHDLEFLLTEILTIYPSLEASREDFQLLTQYAVHYRYPGESADKEEANEAMTVAKRVRKELRFLMNLPPRH
ncbi:MAG: HEPN domain-containing protein [Opitutales bacterium]|nr:HEPN domain-containing protein [Opitutales bacterium]